MEDKENAYKRKGERVKEVRKDAGFSRAELAERINCEKGTLAAIEQGHRNLTLENAELIAKECNVLTNYLLLRSDYKSQQEQHQAAINRLQNLDVMWTEFIKHIAICSGYEMKECENGHPKENGEFNIVIEDPYLIFENDSCSYSFTMRDTNIFMEDISRYAQLRLQMMFERKKRS